MKKHYVDILGLINALRFGLRNSSIASELIDAAERMQEEAPRATVYGVICAARALASVIPGVEGFPDHIYFSALMALDIARDSLGHACEDSLALSGLIMLARRGTEDG